MLPTRNKKKGKRLRSIEAFIEPIQASIPESLIELQEMAGILTCFIHPAFPSNKTVTIYWASSKSLQLRDSSGFTPDSHLMPTEIGNLF